VVGYDNLTTGMSEFLAGARNHRTFEFVEGDVFDPERLGAATTRVEVVFHLAANADVRFGLDHPRRDLEQNTLATFTVLEAMRANGVGHTVFSSTGSVYRGYSACARGVDPGR
jgi:UDP-glucose 4-epimerase